MLYYIDCFSPSPLTSFPLGRRRRETGVERRWGEGKIDWICEKTYFSIY